MSMIYFFLDIARYAFMIYGAYCLCKFVHFVYDVIRYRKKYKQVRELAKRLMKKWELDYNWSFKIGSLERRVLGSCNDRRKNIVVNRRYIKYLSLDQIREILLHEIAHAKVGCDKHHFSNEWIVQALKCGVPPFPSTDAGVEPRRTLIEWIFLILQTFNKCLALDFANLTNKEK